MRSLLGLSISLVLAAAAGCSNACPPPVFCSEPHPDNCPCNIDDAGRTRPDAYVEPVDAFVDPGDDADVDAAAADDAATDDAAVSDDTGMDAHHP